MRPKTTSISNFENKSNYFFLGKWGIVFLLSYVEVTSAQEHAFRNYSIVQGLSESVVNTLIQDEKGYIWMGTGFGLNRFDGHDFTIYLQEDGLKSTKLIFYIAALMTRFG